MKKLILVFLLGLAVANAHGQQLPTWQSRTENASFIHSALKEITDVMVHDIYSPPVAGRTYAYVSIAGYEAALPAESGYRSFAGQLRDLSNTPKPLPGKDYSFTLAAVQAILSVGKSMVISEDKVDEFYADIIAKFKASGMPAEVMTNSIEYGNAVAKHIIAWAATDNYKETRTFTKYSPTTSVAAWKPTPPAYFKAVEPHWNKMRPFMLDSAQQFKPALPTAFSKDSNSQFYSEALAVKDAGVQLSEEQKHIANFWDCNPFKMNVNGHVMFASKKISPGGHWMNITKLVCEKQQASVIKSLEAYACVAITISDAFISCWDEKYRSNVIRPETYINQYIDQSWMPLLQTPPFPEYTSGHSVVSMAASEVLTKIFGENFSYTDSTELEFGIPERHFTSFRQAAQEAAISRFYGGIHYMPSITNGVEEGRQIGKFMVSRLSTN